MRTPIPKSDIGTGMVDVLDPSQASIQTSLAFEHLSNTFDPQIRHVRYECIRGLLVKRSGPGVGKGGWEWCTYPIVLHNLGLCWDVPSGGGPHAIDHGILGISGY